MFTFNFEKLDVWQEAIQFANLIYEITTKFPERERFGLTNQMRRAAVSISSNLAGEFACIADRLCEVR
jgi:four helix bundle protein